MVQNIIVAVVLVGAVVFSGYSVYSSVRQGKKSQSACGGCSGCELKNRVNSCGEATIKNFSGESVKAYPKRAKKTLAKI